MRATIKDLPTLAQQYGWQETLAIWWVELPRSWRYRWWWKALLWEPGQGLLRWGLDTRYEGGWMEPPEPYTVAPPIRRLCMAIRYRAAWPLDMKDKEWLQ